MRALASVVITVLLLLVAGAGPARADLLVASFDTGQVLRYDDTTGAFLGAFAPVFPGDHPVSMTIGPDGNVYVGMNNFADSVVYIRRYNGHTGLFIDTLVSMTTACCGFASGLVFGPDGNLYVADFYRSAVIRYSATGVFIDDFVPEGSGGLTGAEGLTFGPDGSLYVTSRISGEVLRYDGSTGEFVGVFATGPKNGPIALTFGPDGNLYVLIFGGQVLRFDGSTGVLLDVFVDKFDEPEDGANLEFGPDGNLYATTGFSDSVLRFDGTSGRLIDTFVSQGSGGLSYAANMRFITRLPETVSIDVKPGTPRNPINPRSNGRIPVAILSSPSFDATTVDPAKARFGATGTEAHALHSALEDVNGDGDLDLVLHFRTAATGIECGDTSASLTGETFSGQAIRGSDSILTVGCPERAIHRGSPGTVESATQTELLQHQRREGPDHDADYNWVAGSLVEPY